MELEYYRKYEPVFGEYTIKKEIGEGSSGKVFEIEREDVAGTFSAALKAITIPKNRSQIDMISAQKKDPSEYFKTLAHEMQTEVELMAELKGHTNIVSYENHKFIQHDDGVGWDILIQMELLTPLYRYSRVHEITEEDVIKLGIDICSALEVCHKHNIIHRDVKPENIFVTLDGDFKLGDFGIAKVSDETMSGTRIGTDSFMAPEVFNFGKYGASVDIYSLGMVMYTLLNGHLLPFEEETSSRNKSNSRRMLGERIPEPSNAGKFLTEIILKATEFRVEDRYHSATEMKNDLLKLKLGTFTGINDSPVKKNSAGKKIAAAILSLIVIAGGIFICIPKEITDISGIDDTVTIMYGESMSPDYEIKPARFSDEEIIFKTADDKIASIDEDGIITAGKTGETELTLTAMDYEKTVKVIVEPKVEKISGLKKTYEIEEGESLKLKPSLSPEKYEDEEISYKVKDDSVATVSDKGKVTGISAGKTVITISAGGISRKITLTVTEEEESAVYTTQNSTTVSNDTDTDTDNSNVGNDEDLTWGDDDSLEWD